MADDGVDSPRVLWRHARCRRAPECLGVDPQIADDERFEAEVCGFAVVQQILPGSDCTDCRDLGGRDCRTMLGRAVTTVTSSRGDGSEHRCRGGAVRPTRRSAARTRWTAAPISRSRFGIASTIVSRSSSGTRPTPDTRVWRAIRGPRPCPADGCRVRWVMTPSRRLKTRQTRFSSRRPENAPSITRLTAQPARSPVRSACAPGLCDNRAIAMFGRPGCGSSVR